MLRMYKPIFGTGKAVVLGSVLYVAKGIIKLESKDVHTGALTKKRHYWPKGVPEDLIDTAQIITFKIRRSVVLICLRQETKRISRSGYFL